MVVDGCNYVNRSGPGDLYGQKNLTGGAATRIAFYLDSAAVDLNYRFGDGQAKTG